MKKLLVLMLSLLMILPTFAMADASELSEEHLIIAILGNQPDDHRLISEKMSEITKKEINATVELVYFPFSSWQQQFNLAMASGDQIDLTMTGAMPVFAYDNAISSGQLQPIEESMKKYGQGIVDVFEAKVLECGQIDGVQYAVPSIRDFAYGMTLMMRKDLVEKYNIDLAKYDGKGFESLGELFEIIRQNEPDVLPLVSKTVAGFHVFNLQVGLLDNLGSTYGVIPFGSTDYKLTSVYETQEYADLCKLVHSWFEAGYISKDAATTTDTGTSLVSAGRAFSYIVGSKPGIELQESKTCGTDMVGISICPVVSDTYTIRKIMMGVPNTAVDVDRSVMLMNLLYTNAELMNLFGNGVEGVHYVTAEDGVHITYPEGINASNTPYPSDNFSIGNNFLLKVWEGNDADIWEQTREFNTTAAKSSALGFAFDSSPVSDQVAAISNVLSEYQRGLEMGVLDPEEYLPVFIEKLKKAGFDEIIAEQQAQLDAWVAENK